MEMSTKKVWLLLGGIIFSILGVYMILNPGKALASFVIYLGIAKVISGIFGILLFFSRSREKEKYSIIISVLDLVFGLIILSLDFFEIMAALYIFTYVVAIWALARGIIILFKRRDPNNQDDKNVSYGVGLFLILFSILFFIYPLFLTSVAWLSFIYMASIMFILLGIAYLMEFLFGAKSVERHESTPTNNYATEISEENPTDNKES